MSLGAASSNVTRSHLLSRGQDVKTGLHRGFGWVRMSSEQEIQKVLDYKRHTIEGYEVARMIPFSLLDS